MNNENLIQLIYDEIQEMKNRFDEMEEHTHENTEGLKSINLCLENEIWPSIMRVAEGHLDLSRNLKEALKTDQEKENMLLRLNYLEGELRRIRAKMGVPG